MEDRNVLMDQLQNNCEISALLYQASSSEEKFAILEKIILDLGFDALIYSFYPRLSLLSKSLQPVFQYSKSYASFAEVYKKNKLSQHDFVIRLIKEGMMDVIDWGETANKISLTEEEIKTNIMAHHQFGIEKGITFPTLSSDLGLAGVAIVSFKPEDMGKVIDPEVLAYLQTCSNIYHDHMIIHQDDRYEFVLPLLKLLTPKKKIVIKHLISGKPMKNIDGVTVRYAEKLLLELRKDFGDITKNELLYLLGLLNISEYL